MKRKSRSRKNEEQKTRAQEVAEKERRYRVKEGCIFLPENTTDDEFWTIWTEDHIYTRAGKHVSSGKNPYTDKELAMNWLRRQQWR